MRTLNQDGSNGEPYVNHLPGHTELYLVIPIREWDDAARRPHCWRSKAIILAELQETHMDVQFFLRRRSLCVTPKEKSSSTRHCGISTDI